MTMPFSRSSGPGAPMPTPMKSRRARVGLRDRVEDHAFDQSHDAVGDAFGARLGARRNRAHGVVVLAVRRHRAHDDVRSAEIDADDVLLPLLRGHASRGPRREIATSRSSVARQSTPPSSGVISRMQRQCPRGHCCGPCRSHGRQARPDVPGDRGVRRPAGRSRTRERSVRRPRPSACSSPTRDAAAASRSSRAAPSADELGRREQRQAPGGVDRAAARRRRRSRRRARDPPRRRRSTTRPHRAQLARELGDSTASASSPTRCPARARSAVARRSPCSSSNCIDLRALGVAGIEARPKLVVARSRAADRACRATAAAPRDARSRGAAIRVV